MAHLDENTLQRMFDAGCDALERGANDQAIELLQPVAQWGASVAMFNLAIALKRRGDLNRAIEWYTKAARAGDVDAMAYLGWMHRWLGATDEAANWYREAQRHGHQQAGPALAALAFDTTSTAAQTVRATASMAARAHAQRGSMELATQSWMTAAESGDAESMYQLGLAAEQRRDLGEAILWHRAASRAGFAQADARLNFIEQQR
ncbi:tetratricopeptide repeat protein [Nocardioides nitrophenolicus]|uniref:tetratricopeptide repeat protein n=1 Tax=Nocardioides nitrophenolicus TaxID=60489 RepID=UPI00195B8D05|nr:tetratricopeptide repeat protein [Nocardioides nitrophenolicus]MBM7519513.1 TPR repeat protein [Nocardioides nitrophenolicus]